MLPVPADPRPGQTNYQAIEDGGDEYFEDPMRWVGQKGEKCLVLGRHVGLVKAALQLRKLCPTDFVHLP